MTTIRNSFQTQTSGLVVILYVCRCAASSKVICLRLIRCSCILYPIHITSQQVHAASLKRRVINNNGAWRGATKQRQCPIETARLRYFYSIMTKQKCQNNNNIHANILGQFNPSQTHLVPFSSICSPDWICCQHPASVSGTHVKEGTPFLVQIGGKPSPQLMTHVNTLACHSPYSDTEINRKLKYKHPLRRWRGDVDTWGMKSVKMEMGAMRVKRHKNPELLTIQVLE